MQTPAGSISAYCRGCAKTRPLRFAGYAADGAENSIRPRALYRRCGTCGLGVLVLGDVTDAENLCRTILRDWKRRTAADAIDALDVDEAFGMLQETIWKIYRQWDPGRLSFASYATGLLVRRLQGWARDQTGGQVRRNGHGRNYVVQPKAHSPNVSGSLDALLGPSGDRPGGGGLEQALGRGRGHDPHDRSLDLGGLLGPRGR